MRKEVFGDAILYNADCRDVFPLIERVDAVVTDPPYGIGEAAGKNKKRTGGLAIATDYGDDNWDNEPCHPDIVKAMREISKWQIFYGGNYFELPPTPCWLVWDKNNGDNDFADCELAWTNLPKAVRRITHTWNGMIRVGHELREHPTQKPLHVMKWTIGHLPDDVISIMDPFSGSGTTGVAAVQLGKKFIGVEREAKYFDIACRRIEDAVNSGTGLFSL